MIDIWYAFNRFRFVLFYYEAHGKAARISDRELISFLLDANELKTHQMWNDNKPANRICELNFRGRESLIYGNFSVLFNYSPFRLRSTI